MDECVSAWRDLTWGKNPGIDREPIVLQGHTDPVWHAAFPPDGTRVVSVLGWDGAGVAGRVERVVDVFTLENLSLFHGSPTPSISRRGIPPSYSQLRSLRKAVWASEAIERLARSWPRSGQSAESLKSEDLR